MVRYSIDEVTDDMILGESIFLRSGELLLAAGFHLTPRYRARLKELGFHSVGIQVEGTEDVKVETIISDHVQRELAMEAGTITAGVKQMASVRTQSVQEFRKMVRENRQHLNRYLSSAGLSRSVENLIDEVLNCPSVVYNLAAMQKARSDLFSHAIGVTTTALCIARKYHFSRDEMKQLAMGAINFDLGLAALPKELLEKEPVKFSSDERRLYQQHTVYGYLMLSQNPSIAATSAAIALQHHEHQDGTGFPRLMKGENRPPLKDISRKKVIHRFAEIVAVADMYDCLTTYRGGTVLGPADAMRKIIELSGSVLNADIVRTFAAIVPVYPVGTRLRITDAPAAQLIGYYGVVARDNPDNLEKPQLILYETKNRQKLRPPILIDLAKHTGIRFEILT